MPRQDHFNNLAGPRQPQESLVARVFCMLAWLGQGSRPFRASDGL